MGTYFSDIHSAGGRWRRFWSRDERDEEWRNVAPKIERDLALAHRGMPESYFRPSLPSPFYRDTFARRNKIMKKSAPYRCDNTPPVDSFETTKEKIFSPRTLFLSLSLPSLVLLLVFSLFFLLILFYDSWKNTGAHAKGKTLRWWRASWHSPRINTFSIRRGHRVETWALVLGARLFVLVNSPFKAVLMKKLRVIYDDVSGPRVFKHSSDKRADKIWSI